MSELLEWKRRCEVLTKALEFVRDRNIYRRGMTDTKVQEVCRATLKDAHYRKPLDDEWPLLGNDVGSGE